MNWQLDDFIRLELFHGRKFEKLRLIFDCTLSLKIMILHALFIASLDEERPPKIAASGLFFVLSHKKLSDNPAQAQRIELWSKNLEQLRTRGFPNDIVSLYMDSDSICVASANVNRDIYTILNYSLEVTNIRSFKRISIF